MARHINDDEAALENLSPLEIAKQEAADAESEAAESQAFYNFFKRHPELDASEANIHVLRSFVGDGDVHITVGLLDDALKIMLERDHFPLSRRTSGQDEREREKIVEKILDFKNGDSTWEANERARLNLVNPTNKQYVRSLDDLRQLLEETELRAKFQKMSVQELKAFVKPPEPAPEILPSKFSAAILKAMAPGAIRQLIGRYGVAALNARLAGEN